MSLFTQRSTSFRRNETELVIIVTPYLVRPSSGQLATPIDGYRAPTDPQQMLEGQTYTGKPVTTPTAVPAVAAQPAAGAPAPGFKL